MQIAGMLAVPHWDFDSLLDRSLLLPTSTGSTPHHSSTGQGRHLQQQQGHGDQQPVPSSMGKHDSAGSRTEEDRDGAGEEGALDGFPPDTWLAEGQQAGGRCF